MGMDRAGGSSRNQSWRRLSSVLPFAFLGGRRGKEAMVAKAKAVACMGVLLGATLAPATAAASVPVALLNHVTAAAPGQTESRLTRAHSALNAAIDSQRQGKYEQADVLFREAQAHQTELTAEERQDLANRMKANASALQARREGDEQLRKAEAAYKAGRTGEAEDLLKKVIANSSVSSDNRRKAMQLAGQIRPRGVEPNSAVNTPAVKTPAVNTSLPLARAKVQQARALVTRIDLDGAEQLALEAKKMNATFTASEDTPDKIMRDVAGLRNDPKALLAAARAACERGDYDHAEKYAHMCEQKESMWTIHFRGDSPSKVLKDARAGRARMAQTSIKAPAVAQSQKPMDAGSVAKETVVNPPRVETMGAPPRVETPAAPKSPYAAIDYKSTPPAVATPAPAKPEDVPALMQQARDLMAAGKLDEANKVAYRAKAALSTRTGWSASWQLFEDTPDKLIKEINKAKQQRDQEESVRVLAEGRKLLEQGDLEGASKCAFKAEGLHGPYSIMELGDRPHKLHEDIRGAAEQRRKSGAPAATVKPNDTQVAGSTTMPAPGTPLAGMGQQAVRPGSPGADTGSPYQQGAVGNTAKASGPAAPGADTKAKAQALLANARQLQREGKLIEARQKALECQRMGVAFGPDEDRPEQALVQLNMLAGKKIDGLVAEADDYMATAGGSADRMNKVEANLVQARQLAVSFGLDTFRLDSKLGTTRQALAQARTGAQAPPMVPVGYQQSQPAQATATDTNRTPSGPPGVGAEMLVKARLELRRGHTEVARRIAEEALRGNYGVKLEAEAVLRDINREEYSQSMLTAGRTFEAG